MGFIFNEDCLLTMKNLPEESVDIVLTSPPYNTSGTNNNNDSKASSLKQARYDVYSDNKSSHEYQAFTQQLFEGFEKILKPNGCVLYNISYGANGVDSLLKNMVNVIENTDFTIADVIAWKKKNAVPNDASPNKLTRIWEFVFVFCKKEDFYTFTTNKKPVKEYKNVDMFDDKPEAENKKGNIYYENIFNMFEAANNDGTNPYNSATFSVEFVKKLLNIYAKEEIRDQITVYDPFGGTGTTALACEEMGIDWIMSELSANQCKWAENRLKTVQLSFL